MSYSGVEPVELLALRARLCGISTDAQTIRELSAQMRQPSDPGIQALVVKIWLADVRQAKDPSRLLALFYLANDVVQLLRGSEQCLVYRYNFAAAIAEAIVVIRQEAPVLIAKLARVIAIFRERTIYDTHILALLQRCLQEDLQAVIASVLPAIRTETAPSRVGDRIRQLEAEIRNKQHHSVTRPTSSSSSITSTGPVVVSPSQQPTLRLITAVQLPPPPIEDLIEAGKALEKLRVFQRPQQFVNLDAEVVSRIRGYRIPVSARIHSTDTQLIHSYQLLLKHNLESQNSIDEKVLRRQREEENNQFLLIPNRHTQSTSLTAAKRVEVLLKKEWNLRCEKQQIEYAIYWHLVNILDHLIDRWNRIQSIAEGIETEIKRRNDVKQMPPPAGPEPLFDHAKAQLATLQAPGVVEIDSRIDLGHLMFPHGYVVWQQHVRAFTQGRFHRHLSSQTFHILGKWNICSTKFESFWRRIRFPVVTAATCIAGLCGYQFYRSGYNLQRTRFQLELSYRKLCHLALYRAPLKPKAQKNSRFSTGLPAHLAALVSLYFLQLDLDKQNGVRKSDILILLNQCGIERPLELPSVQSFLEAHNRRNPHKHLSGCELQDLLDLLETLAFGNEIAALHESFTSEDSPKNGSEFCAALEQQLRKQTRGTSVGHPAAIHSLPLQLTVTLPTSLRKSPVVEVTLPDKEVLQDDIARLKRLREMYFQMQERSALTEAQEARLHTLTYELARLQLELDTLSSETAIKNAEKRHFLEDRSEKLRSPIQTLLKDSTHRSIIWKQFIIVLIKCLIAIVTMSCGHHGRGLFRMCEMLLPLVQA